jgi:hypothetical protein
MVTAVVAAALGAHTTRAALGELAAAVRAGTQEMGERARTALALSDAMAQAAAAAAAPVPVSVAAAAL